MALGSLIDIGGRRLHLMAAGSASPTVVFESGGGGGSSLQDLPIQRLVAPLCRTIVYDRAGLGWSDPGPARRSFEERAEDLRLLLDRIAAPPPYVLVGSSFGGHFARTFCRLWPADVAGLVLVDAPEEGHYFPTMARMRGFHEVELRTESGRAASGELRAAAEPLVARARAFSEDEKAAMLELMSRPGHFLAALEEMSAIDRATPEQRAPGGLGGLGNRPLIVLSHGVAYAGEMAVWEEGFEAGQRRLAALSSVSAHIVAEGVGHSIGLEKPALVAAAIMAVVKAAGGGGLDVGEVERIARG